MAASRDLAAHAVTIYTARQELTERSSSRVSQYSPEAQTATRGCRAATVVLPSVKCSCKGRDPEDLIP